MDPAQHPDRSLESEIYLANSDGSNMKMLLGKEGMSYNSAVLSHNGKWLALEYSKVGYVSVPTLALDTGGWFGERSCEYSV